MTVMASAVSKRFAAKGRLAPSATRSWMRARRAVSRHKARARARRRRLASTPTTSPRRPTSAARSRTTTPVPQPTSRTRSPTPTRTNLRKRRRSRACAGVWPRASRPLAISSTLIWASASRHGSGCARAERAGRTATAAGLEPRRLTRGPSAAGVAAGALLAAEVPYPAGVRAADGARLHDVSLADRILDELVGKRAARGGSRQLDPAQEREQQHGRDDQDQKNRKKPHATQRCGLIHPP